MEPLKRAGLMCNGYIQVTFEGGTEAQGGVLQAPTDENTVVFHYGRQGEFAAIKAALDRKMAALRGAPPAAQSLGIDDLEKLASLRDRGILTEEEFMLKKRQILGI